ncbi:Cytochrome P450 78A6 [Ananas comosus]|uniref:Cytochrome P450 78A6 n=1 Tax=Ananas comosus TaxID=4615 RepID=A0A199W5W5_ANACO|nr:Cytochrome P450 78A6 [Ananas comosus]
MGSIVENGWVLSLSLAAKCGGAGAAAAADSPHLLFLAALFVLAVSATALLHWAAPGGPAWGRYWSSQKRRRNTPEAKPIPGPRGLPIVGSIGLMSGLSHRKLAAAADAFAARRLMAISVGETRVVVTADPNVAREILSSMAFADRPVKESAYGLMFRRAIGFAPYGPYWRSLRRIAAAHLFSPSQIAAFADRRSAIAAQMVAALKSAAAAAARGGRVEVRGVLKAASLSHMMWIVFGKKYDLNMDDKTTWCEEMQELRFMVDEGYQLLGTLNWSDHLPALAGLDPQRVRSRCARLVPRVNRFMGRIIDECRFGPARDPDTAPAFVNVLLSLQDREQLSDEDMRAVLWEMIFRGTDTVAVLLEWVLARATLHRGVQVQAHAELDSAATDHHHHHFPLPYLQAIIKETLRLHPPGPLLSWARLATSDTVLSGRHVPEGTTAVVNMWAIARDPALWSRPEEFRPDRFIEPDGEAVGLSVFGSDLRLAPFGSGRRSCPGKGLAMAAVGSWAAALLHEFEWAPTPAAPVDLSELDSVPSY